MTQVNVIMGSEEFARASLMSDLQNLVLAYYQKMEEIGSMPMQVQMKGVEMTGLYSDNPDRHSVSSIGHSYDGIRAKVETVIERAEDVYTNITAGAFIEAKFATNESDARRAIRKVASELFGNPEIETIADALEDLNSRLDDCLDLCQKQLQGQNVTAESFDTLIPSTMSHEDMSHIYAERLIGLPSGHIARAVMR